MLIPPHYALTAPRHPISPMHGRPLTSEGSGHWWDGWDECGYLVETTRYALHSRNMPVPTEGGAAMSVVAERRRA